MPRYETSDINHIIDYDEFKRLLRACRGRREQVWITLLWLTGARPSELLELLKKDIVIEADRVSFTIKTKKLKKQGFIVEKRTLVLHISEEEIYIKILGKYLKRLRDDSRIFQFTRQTGDYIIKRISYDALGISLCSYNFRHSRMTLLAEKGATMEDLKRFKGARTDHSVRPYVHARKVEYSVEAEI